MKRSRGRSVALGTAVLGLAVLAALAFVGREWIENRFWLWKLESASGEAKYEYIDLLVARKYAPVTPHLLQYFKDHPFSGTILMTMGVNAMSTRELVSIGSGAVPYLASAIEEQDANHRVILEALGQLGPRSLPALPTLIRYLGTKPANSCAGEAIDAVGAIGEKAAPAVPVLLTFQRDQDETLRWALYEAVRQIGPGARAAIPLLVDAVEFENDERLVRAARALLRIEPGRPEILPALLRGLRDESQFARAMAAETLGELGAEVISSAPALLELVEHDKETGVILAAAKAMNGIDPGRGLAQSLKLVRETTAESRHRGVIALGELQARAAEAVPVLLELTADSDADVARAAVASLGNLGPGARSAVGRLLEIVQRAQSEELVTTAADSLAEIGDATPEVLAAFCALLPGVPKHGDRQVAQALRKLAKQSSSVVDMLIAALEKDRDTRLGVIEVLSWIEPAPENAIPSLSRIAADRSDKDLSDRAESAIRGIRASQAREKSRERTQGN